MNRLSTIVLVGAFALPGVALADKVDVSVTAGQMVQGKVVPAVHVKILEPIAGFELKLTRSDGHAINIKGGGKPGVTRHLEIDQPLGAFTYKGELIVISPNGETGSMPVEFPVELQGPVKLTVRNEDVDLVGRKIRFRLDRPAKKAHLKVVMDSGQIAMDDDILYNGEPAGTVLEARWPEGTGRILMISLAAQGESTVTDSVELFPWEVPVPHTDVIFEFGKWDVRKEEEPKLEESYKSIAKEIRRAREFADVTLYVFGHTDRVGTPASNKTLSLNRAKAIASHFRRRGLDIPIYFEGYGEEWRYVDTPDEVEEARNRRVDYVLRIGPNFQPKGAPFSPRWRKL